MWENLEPLEQLDFLKKFAGLTNGDSLDYYLIYTCEDRLNPAQRNRYVDLLSSIVADATYRRVDPDSPEAATLYYFNMMRVPHREKARALYFAITGNDM